MFFVSTRILFAVYFFGQVKAACTVNEDITTCRNENLLRILLNALQTKNQNNIKRPVFFASLTKDTTLTNITTILKFDDVRTNIGNGYDSTTGVFTAPKSGIYKFNCLIRAKGSNEVHFQLNKNDKLYTWGYVSKGHYNSQTISSVVKLIKMDRVYIKHRKTFSQTVSGDNSSTFSGNFLQE
ncbi:complement C1q tumor necrosis factor-related protein 3-like [Mytilus edulis]|uniref:complement C1q tumor necrosis factor-related protein 3-like n=1 Tax=Mytilus edulis TaxID=6550 RepID=UPI0039EFB6A3